MLKPSFLMLKPSFLMLKPSFTVLSAVDKLAIKIIKKF